MSQFEEFEYWAIKQPNGLYLIQFEDDDDSTQYYYNIQGGYQYCVGRKDKGGQIHSGYSAMAIIGSGTRPCKVVDYYSDIVKFNEDVQELLK